MTLLRGSSWCSGFLGGETQDLGGAPRGAGLSCPVPVGPPQEALASAQIGHPCTLSRDHGGLD